MHAIFDSQSMLASYEVKFRFEAMEKASRMSALEREALATGDSTKGIIRTQFFMMFWVRRVLFRLAPSVAYRLAV